MSRNYLSGHLQNDDDEPNEGSYQPALSGMQDQRPHSRASGRPRSVMSPGGDQQQQRVRWDTDGSYRDENDDNNENLLEDNELQENSNEGDDSNSEISSEDSVRLVGIRKRTTQKSGTGTPTDAAPAEAPINPPNPGVITAATAAPLGATPTFGVAAPPRGASTPATPGTQRLGGSALIAAAQTLIEDSPATLLKAELQWQQNVGGDAAKIKSFRSEALQRSDLLVFGYMRPASPFVHLLHTAGTFSLPSGDDYYRGKDIAFVGDRTEYTNPTPVQLAPEQPWKWITKKVGLDSLPLEQFYATPGNAAKLYQPIDRTGEQNVTLPRLLAIPPHYIEFVASGQRTPFQLHQHVVQSVTANNHPITIQDCQLVLDWCVMASHHDTQPHTSFMAFALEAAISTDDTFNKWIQRRLRQTLGSDGHHTLPSPSSTQPAPVAQFTIPPGLPPTGTMFPPQQTGFYPPPPPNMWAQFAQQFSQGLAAAMQPTASALAASAGGLAAAYEDGGRNYDKYQLAVIRGFSHSPNLNGVQQIWALFQTTKHADTHKNNLKRKMIQWADAQRPPVAIDRNLYITNATLKDILALRFNPGNSMAELETADQGISILICRPRTSENKAAQRKKELIEGRASKNLSLDDATKLFSPGDTALCPEDYNSLTKCIGTYCALLHTLFGSKCQFWIHCMALLGVLNSDVVSEKQHAFTPLFCRQVIWAIVEDGRAYFSKQLTVDDFLGVHPDDIAYPESTLVELKPHLRNQSPIHRSTFPPQWLMTEPHQHSGLTSAGSVQAGQRTFPVSSFNTGPPSVVSGISNPSTTTTRQQAQVQIRASTHPIIKAALAEYVKKFRSIRLTQLLTSLNLTLADLPTMPSMAASDTTLCYNYVLGRCVHSGCQHKHAPVEEVTDDFATALVNLLKPAIQNFMTHGAPAQPRRKRRRSPE